MVLVLAREDHDMSHLDRHNNGVETQVADRVTLHHTLSAAAVTCCLEAFVRLDWEAFTLGLSEVIEAVIQLALD